ncbi:MAG: hypothetical protein FWE10_07090 [Rikenellaceae bacterium]|nr:hypothetical protein [Rikenellaceae bacterium]MCL2693412.1 hypothetical protein [Rikenellaceae bacterium]
MRLTTIFRKITLFAVVATTVLATACMDKLEIPPISISRSVFHVVQTGDAQFRPHIGFQWDGIEALATAEIKWDGELMNAEVIKQARLCFIDPFEYQVSSLTELNGRYSMNPIGEKGASWFCDDYVFSFTGDEAMDEVQVVEFKYEDSRLHVTFNAVENATGYGFYIQAMPGNTLQPYPTAFNMFVSVAPTVSGSGKLTGSISFNPAYAMYGVEQFRITPYAMNFTPDTSNRVFRMGNIAPGTLDASQQNTTVVWREETPEE